MPAWRMNDPAICRKPAMVLAPGRFASNLPVIGGFRSCEENPVGDSNLTDPLGRTIRLHEQTWVVHILRRHPEMALHREAVENAIVDPLEIRRSPADADCRMYFGDGPRKGILVLVIADVVSRFVKTAHLVRSMKGAVEWSRPTPSKES
jgi:hypothetical protein